MLNHIQEYLDDHMSDRHYDINIMGDFNFPNINWTTSICSPSHGREQHESGEALLNFITHNMLSQLVDKPTRGTNILDLFLTNNERIIHNFEVSDSPLSDHRVVKVNLLINLKSPGATRYLPEFEDGTFHFLDI